VDYFELLGIQRTYALDPLDLKRRFLVLSRELHPDRFISASDETRGVSESLSAQLNQAYEVLSHPVRRADYMLRQAGGPTAAEDRAVPQDVLMEMMEVREEIDHARAAGDEATLNRHRESMSRKYAACLEEIGELAARIDHEEEARRRLRTVLNTVKYYSNALEQL
jgi:molecular chaperone HscB